MNKPKKDPRKRVLLPSERYPNLDVIEKLVTLDKALVCPCCSKAVTDSNVYRRENKLPVIKNIYCNAQARRKFKETQDAFLRESAFFIWCYKKIYHLEKDKTHKNRRPWQRLYYRAMERLGLSLKSSYSSKISLVKAINYLLNNYETLTYFLSREDLPIDNNSQERLMRSPVVGRMTWYGTHSTRGAETNAVLFSLVESCKLNKINPMGYFKDIVHTIHEKRPIYTPGEYKIMKSANPARNSLSGRRFT